jgi:hypothetical protein
MVSPRTGKRLLGWSRRLYLLEGAESSKYWSRGKSSTCTIALLQYFGYPYSFDSAFERYKREREREGETETEDRKKLHCLNPE